MVTFGMSRSMRVSMGVAVGLVAVLGATGCGTAPTDSEAAAAEGTDQRLAELDNMIWGSNRARSAGAYLGHLELNQPIDSCMKELGLPFSAPYVDGYGRLADPGGGNGTWTVPLMNTSTSSNIAAAAIAAEETEVLEQGPSEQSIKSTDEYSRALRQCDKEGNYDDVASPKGSLELSAELAGIVGIINADVGEVAPYVECMKTAGFDVTREGYEGYDGLVALLQASAPELEKVPPPGVDGGAAWSDFLALEQEALQADSDCRLPRHVEAMSKIDQALDTFESENADEITRIASEWDSIIEEATARGWVDVSSDVLTNG